MAGRLLFTTICRLALAVTVLGGCATAPPVAAPVDGIVATGALAVDPVDVKIDRVRQSYYGGVRAWVGEDLDNAEGIFNECREQLAFADDDGTFNESQASDAQSLLAKIDYYLGLIDERRIADAEPPSETSTADLERVAAAAAEWPLVTGPIFPTQNKQVERWIRYFTGEGRPIFQSWLDRRARYAPLLEPVLRERGLPRELIFHAMIESGFNPGAYSWAHAVGLWQFVLATGRHLGMRIDWWVDERRDPRKSTAAAASYLTALYNEFEDWELALAAYNVGEGRIRSQIRRQGTRDFWSLRLPRETRNHVPKFYAAMILGSDPETYGFRIKDGAPPVTEAIHVDYSIDFEVLAEVVGISAKKLAELNPSLVRRCTPPDEADFPVLVPFGRADATQTALAALPKEKRVRWAQHRVRNGESLSLLAVRYGTTVRAIQEANQLRSAHHVRIGQELVIPRGRRTAGTLPQYAQNRPTTAQKLVHVVRNGDTLSEIAEKYGTSARKIRRWNRLGKYIHPGQRLTIYAKPTQVASSRSSGQTVRVRKGDTLWDIARLHGVSLGALKRANNLEADGLIRPGERIRIP